MACTRCRETWRAVNVTNRDGSATQRSRCRGTAVPVAPQRVNSNLKEPGLAPVIPVHIYRVSCRFQEKKAFMLARRLQCRRQSVSSEPQGDVSEQRTYEQPKKPKSSPRFPADRP